MRFRYVPPAASQERRERRRLGGKKRAKWRADRTPALPRSAVRTGKGLSTCPRCWSRRTSPEGL